KGCFSCGANLERSVSGVVAGCGLRVAEAAFAGVVAAGRWTPVDAGGTAGPLLVAGAGAVAVFGRATRIDVVAGGAVLFAISFAVVSKRLVVPTTGAGPAPWVDGTFSAFG